MLILFIVGTGAIRGFAITISMGILISMFTAIVLVRLLISYWLRWERPKSLQIGTRLGHGSLHRLVHRAAPPQLRLSGPPSSPISAARPAPARPLSDVTCAALLRCLPEREWR
jgi:hypothetical protein